VDELTITPGRDGVLLPRKRIERKDNETDSSTCNAGSPSKRSRFSGGHGALHRSEHMNSLCPQASKDASEGVRFTPADIVRRRKAEWNVSQGPVFRGGLAGWQQKKVTDFIEGHLNEDIALQELANMAELSRYHFARAFKQSFGVPPHRYHMGRRMERAKTLLEERTRSVTQVGLMLGFAETSSFTTSFRRTVGVTPSDFRRSIL
jgi:AraC-like DNA-binding protein